MQCRNLAEMLRVQAGQLGPRTAVRYKQHGLYHDISWQRYRANALACAAALVDAGMRPGERVGILAENRLEWLIADLGLLSAAAVNVPPHAPLTARQVHFQLEDANVRWLFVSTAAQLEKVSSVLPELPAIKGVVVFDPHPLTPSPPHPLTLSWSAFLQHGRQVLPRHAAELERREAALGPDDLATIMYTSGTTGNPKGVMLTHGNLCSNALAAMAVSPIGPHSIVLNWLPFSHIYARTVDHYGQLVARFVMCLAESVETLVQNLDEVQPTNMSSVPRFYEKVLTTVASPDPAETGRRLRRIFGPRVDWLGSGGAPLPLPVAEAYHAAGVLLLQGYGLTESSPVISFNRKSQYKLDTVGLPIPGVEVKIAPDGEVLTRGPHVMKGYWKNPDATAATIRDGWLYTGDLGSIDEDGFLKITGRKKEVMVLSNGKKVVPSYLEGLLVGEPCIEQAVVCGEGRNFLTALLVPNWVNVRKALHTAGQNVDHEPEEVLTRNGAVRRLLEQRIAAALAEVAGWEQVRKFVVLPRPFSVAADELTVSLKLRRNVVLAKYQAELDALYREESPSSQARESKPAARVTTPSGPGTA